MDPRLSFNFTALHAILQQNIPTKLNSTRFSFLVLLILALCQTKTVNYDRLSRHILLIKPKALSVYRRIQRFMQWEELTMEWVSALIFNLLPSKENLVLSMDRTNWKFGSININILMLAVGFRGTAIPLMFMMLDKQGNSDTLERMVLIRRFIALFGRDCISRLLADREFIGKDWLRFLKKEKINYYIRIRENFILHLSKKDKGIKAFSLFKSLQINEYYHYPRQVIMHENKCYVSGIRLPDEQGKAEYLILVSYTKTNQSAAYYKDRWAIEMVFKGLKTSDFNLEDTHVTDLKRIERLLLVTMIAYLWCYLVGDYIDTHIQKIKIKKHGRKAVSIFKSGLDYISRLLNIGSNPHGISIFRLLSCT